MVTTASCAAVLSLSHICVSKQHLTMVDTDLNIMCIVHSATIDCIFQQAPQLLPVRLTACTAGSHNLCPTSDITEIEVIEAGPALQCKPSFAVAKFVSSGTVAA